MDIWVVAALVVIVASIVYSAWKQTSFAIIASVACVAVVIIGILGPAGVQDELAFMPHDILDPAREYTLLTSMFMHAGFAHLFLNLLMLVLVGLLFEQRIGTRPFMVLYILAGLIGTLVFAAFRWGDLVTVVGASGAIMGILGGFARLYPNEKMMFPIVPVPMSIWTMVVIMVLLQLVFILGEARVAVEAHIGGLIAGIVLAPYVVRLPLGQKTSTGAKKVRALSAGHLRKLATTPELKSMLDRIEHEEVPDVRNAWMEHFVSNAKCPECGSRLRIEKDSIVCEKGHIV